MAKIHVLEGSATTHQFTIVVHAPAPVGINAAGVAWATAIANSGHNTSILPVGNAAGQITQAELNQIQAGSVIEVVSTYWDDVTLTQAQRLAALDALATRTANDLVQRYQDQLQYFGLTRT